MISKISGRYISFYADELTDMLLDDFLLETAEALNENERKTRKTYVGEEAKTMAEDALLMMEELKNEASLIEKKWEKVGEQP